MVDTHYICPASKVHLMNDHILVTKSSGAIETFDLGKLRYSLSKSKAGPEEINSVINELMPKLYEGIPTEKIYREAFRLLRRFSKDHAARYYLKRGIMELGPSGFPFEMYIAALFKHQGYTVSVGNLFKGKCVDHEVDVLAKKGTDTLLMECKYRHEPGIKVDVKTPLYIQARFEDIKDQRELSHEGSFIGWIVTNAGFSSDAISYSHCKGLKILSWAYPKNQGLKDIIDETGLYPVTCLTTITNHEKQSILAKNFVLVGDINAHPEILQKAGIKESRHKNILEECIRLCSPEMGMNSSL